MVLCFMKVALRHGVSLDHALLEQNITNISLKSVVVGFSPSAKEVVNGTRITRSPLNDIVSKNITLVLENLLKNYESSQLPTHGKVQILYNVAPRTAAVKLNVFRTANTSHKLKRQPMARKMQDDFYIPLSIANINNSVPKLLVQ
ncbi:hypothetical protein NQ317_019048 [Molorchus minor]|uniref:Uncharacterized protein n=1 Tax=Molorchus minor TaxID=1323400 RepID=A0ABQ9JXR1_9CUCU|nr:hypothetical protein NQ317_019048 [Molorchus minor]